MTTENYCVYTNNWAFIDNDGYSALCCKNIKNKLHQYHIKDFPLKEIWNSPEMNSVRQEIADGGEPAGCFKCYEPERNGVRSFRQKALGMLNRGKRFEDHSIRALDLRIGNICNLACTMCFAGNSNLIYKQLPAMSEHFNWPKGRVEKELEKYHARNYDWSNDDKAWDNILTGIDENLRYMYIAGGEPFYLRHFPETVEKISKYAPNARFGINTNGTRLLREKDLIKFQGIKDVNIRFSVDGMGKSDEFTRQGTVWEEKVEVMKQYYEHFSLNVWDITANALSVRQIPELIEFLHTNFPKAKVQIRPVVNVDALTFDNIPMELKQESLDFFIKHEGLLGGVDHVIHEMKKPQDTNPMRKVKMKQFVDYWEKAGTVRIEDFDPEMAEWLAKDEQ
jgi:MoaA/NifB/PqqE/SkfB family radical SAM enzyme